MDAGKESRGGKIGSGDTEAVYSVILNTLSHASYLSLVRRSDQSLGHAGE